MPKPLVCLFPFFALLVLIGCGGRSERSSSDGCVGVASAVHARDAGDAPDTDGSTTGDEDSTTGTGETTGTGAGTTTGDVDESTTGSIETTATPTAAGCP